MEKLTLSNSPSFPLGQLVATAGVDAEACENPAFAIFVGISFDRYTREDWGDLCKEDRELNALALKNDGRLFAAYEGEVFKIWIITEWDRSATTILFPDEY